MKNFLFACLFTLFATNSIGHAQAQLRRGSIYSAATGPFGLVADKKASRAGDLVTILISETTDVIQQDRSDFQRASELDYSLNAFNIKPNSFNFLPQMGSSTSDSFNGEALQEKRGTFTARLTAVVIDALPNGNLIIRGRREIRVDKQVKTIEFSGIVRRYDILANNTVQSEQVADAKVSYTGVGPATDTTGRSGLGGLIHSAIVWIWPF